MIQQDYQVVFTEVYLNILQNNQNMGNRKRVFYPLFLRLDVFMKITILCVGKVKEKFYRDGIAEFVKRLSRYCKLEIVEVADEKTTEDASETEIRIVKEKEGERLLKNIKDDARVAE